MLMRFLKTAGFKGTNLAGRVDKPNLYKRFDPKTVDCAPYNENNLHERPREKV